MALLVDIIAGRLAATGVEPAFAERFAIGVTHDLHRAGYVLVASARLDLLGQQSKELAEAWARLQRTLLNPPKEIV